MAKTMKKLLSLVLVAIMVLSMIPAVSAEEEIETVNVEKISDMTNILKGGSEFNSVAGNTIRFVLQDNVTVTSASAIYIGKYVEEETETDKGHGTNVILDLNGFTLTDECTSVKYRTFALYNGSTLTVKNGKIVSNAKGYKSLGGIFFGHTNSDFTLENVTVETTAPSTSGGGVLYTTGSSAVVTINNSTITRLGGDCAGNGSIIHMKGGKLYLNDSHISGGRVVQTVLGKAAQGGNIYLEEGAQATMNGGSITNGYVEGATATGTAPSTGGNVYLYGAKTKFTLNSGIISGGEAKTIGIKKEGAETYSYGYATGGNVGVQGKDGNNRAYFIMNGGQVIKGKVTYDKNTSASTYRRGGNFGLYSNANVTINAGEVSGGSSYRGGAVVMWTTSCSLETYIMRPMHSSMARDA